MEIGLTLLEVAEYAEDLTRKMGGEAAFPCNISINEIASHYTPLKGKRTFAAGNLVKLDVGVHVNGYIADTAATIEVDTHINGTLIEAAKEALDGAIKETRAGVTTRHLGSVMEHIIRARGCRPIPDLTGHSIGRYAVHNGLNIPNHGHAGYSNTLEVGDVIAIEPFTTKGNGLVKHGKARIVSLVNNSMNRSDPVYRNIRAQFNTLPFTSRWMNDPDELKQAGTFLRKYPVLIEKDSYPVAQAEHTLIVTENGCEVITA
ncbi:MAG: type II methionyl aminopeptidase [ANME-2 cluster archaeon]|nr:type II methionyl aminopeptidase [ANME-2 cluster archaeon]